MNKRLENLLLLLTPLLIFYPSFHYFFFQDDFLHLQRSYIQNFSDFLGFFKPPTDAIYYRPLSLQSFFYLTRILFGLKPLAFRLIAFLFFLLNIFLVRKVIKKITGDKSLSFMVAFLFGISSVHFISLFWICEFSLILGTFFFLLTFYFYPKGKSLFFFFLGLLSHELMMILPFLLGAYQIIFKKKNYRPLMGFFLLSLFYFIFRFVLFPIPLQGTYRLTFGKKNLSALGWYILWSFNLPEELKYQMVLSELKIRKEFVFNFLPNFIIWTLGLLAILFFLLLPLFKRKFHFDKPFFNKKAKKTLIFAAIWIFITLLPLIFAPYHQYPMYLIFSLPALYLFLMRGYFSFRKNGKGGGPFLILGLFFLLSLVTTRFTEKTHWVIQEAKKAKNTIEKLKNNYPEVSENLIFVLPDDKQLKASLADQKALEVFYGEKTKTLYVPIEDLIRYRKDQYKVLPLN